MLIYYLLILSVILIYAFSREPQYASNGDIQSQERAARGKHFLDKETKLLVFLCTILFFVIALRGISVGTDTQNYYREFVDFTKMSQPSSFIDFIKGEYGFKFIFYLFNLLGGHWFAFQCFYALLISFSVGYFIHNFSKNICVSFVLFVTIGIFPMTLTGIRQSIAVAFVTCSFVLLKNKKIIPSIILLLASVTVHYTSLICLVIPVTWILSKLGKNKLFIVFLGIAIPVAIRLFGNRFLDLFQGLLLNKYENSGYYSNNNLTMNPIVLLMYWVIFLFISVGYLFKKKKLAKTEVSLYLFSSFFIACYEMSSVVYMMSRLSYYFSLFFVVCLTNAIDDFRIKQESKRDMSLLILVLCSLSFFISIPGSSFGIDNYIIFGL